MPEIKNNQNEREVPKEEVKFSVPVFQDNQGVQYTKQRLFEGIIGMNDGSMFGKSGVNSNWLSAIEQMGKWYETNIHTYQGKTEKPWAGKHWFMCPLINDKVADDCSGFVQACLRLFGVNCYSICTADMQKDKFMNMMKNSGFTHETGIFTKDNLQPGDIICGGPSTHTEIYAGEGKSWSWGSIHDGQNGHSKMPCNFCKLDKKGGYIHRWRKS